MIKKTMLVLGLLFVANWCYSQSKQVTVIGTMPQLYGGEYVSFSKPIGKYTTSRFYINSDDNAVLKNDKFIKTINISGPGIINIYEKPYSSSSSARFFAEPGDTIELERQKGEILFKGKNAVVNKMFTDIKISPVGFSEDVYGIFKTNKNYDQIIAKINAKEKEYCELYNELFLKKQISKACMEYTKIMMEQSIDIFALSIAKDKKYREEEKIRVGDEGIERLVDYFNLKYIPYKEENLNSLLFYSLIRTNALYLQTQSLKENKEITRFWNQFDDIFKSNPSNFGAIDYIASDDYKELYIGSYFMELIKSYNNDQSINYKDLILVYRAFAEKFPNSPYIIPLSESIMNIAFENLKTDDTNTTSVTTKTESTLSLGSLAIYNTTLEPVGTTPFAKPNQSLVEALAEKFPNQDLFIDFWATFCSPCIKQFSYNPYLHSFLDSKNIKTLYISFDKEESKMTWEKYIQNYHLTGYHFLAENTYREKYLETLGPTIPRYFVYNSKTKKLLLVEGVPSEKEKFYTQITKALNNKI